MLSRNIKKEFIFYLMSMIITLVASVIILDIWDKDLKVPFNYSSDVFGSLNAAQSFINGGNQYYFPNMGAPGEVYSYFPDSSNIQYGIIYLMSLFIKSSTLIINIFFILSFPAIALTTTIALRSLKISPFVSILASVLYSLLPSHFYRGEFHLSLATYGEVPLLCVVIFWLMNNQIKFSPYKSNSKYPYLGVFSIFNFKTTFSFVTSFITAASNPYYTFFALIMLAFAMVYAVFENNKLVLKNAKMSLFIIATTILFLIINLFPYIQYKLQNIETTDAVSISRNPVESDIFSLRLGQLILPVDNHRIPLLAHFKSEYNSTFQQFINENGMATLGFIMSIGLIISLFSVFFMNSLKNRLIIQAGLLNLFALVLSFTGGIASLIALFQNFIRCYNRISVFVAFFSLIVICVLADNLIHKFKNNKNKLRKIKLMMIIIIIVGILDQCPVNFSVQNQAELYHSNVNFVKQIEDTTQKGGMIFQLPVVPPDNFSGYKNMGAYELFYPIIHSENLRWTYRPAIGSDVDRWQRVMSVLPTDEFLKRLAFSDFSGIYIDRYGYEASEYSKIENELSNLLGQKPKVSDNQRMSFFSIEKYSTELRSKYSKEQLVLLQQQALSNDYPINLAQPLKATDKNTDSMFISGWNSEEEWGRWSEGRESKINLSLVEQPQNDSTLTFSANIFAPLENLKFNAKVNGEVNQEFSFNAGYHKFSLKIPRENIIKNNNKLSIVFEINNPISPKEANVSNDERNIGIGLIDILIE
ncbi:DUF7024 domain-containing protein [Paenibacillus humicus]|uniref:DUF7024 domain-containing protein n=1 Tax=Paenibacillus humicus TaxID=412861 RepID=UPI003F135821